MSNPPGATIYIDRRDLGSRGDAPRTLGLPPGKYKVIAELAGHWADLDATQLFAAGQVGLAVKF